jgi:methylated-DNA-[protein]-cysteine S-methyltransferase
MKFGQRVYEVVKQIPQGKVMTYKQVAERLKSKAYRAVGNALKNNPDTEHIPCHRVIRSNRKIGGYFGHIDDCLSSEKERKLEAEGVKIKDGKVEISDIL